MAYFPRMLVVAVIGLIMIVGLLSSAVAAEPEPISDYHLQCDSTACALTAPDGTFIEQFKTARVDKLWASRLQVECEPSYFEDINHVARVRKCRGTIEVLFDPDTRLYSWKWTMGGPWIELRHKQPLQ